MQHLESYQERGAKFDFVVTEVKTALTALENEGIDCEIISGGGTGSYYFEEILEFLMSCSVVHTRSWMPITVVF